MNLLLIDSTTFSSPRFSANSSNSAEETLQNSLLNVLDAIPEAAIMISANGAICININQLFSTLTGYSSSEIMNHPLLDLNLLNLEQVKTVFQQVKAHNRVQDWECEYCKKTGEKRIASLSASLFEMDGQSYILLLFRDISDRKQLEQELQQARVIAEAAEHMRKLSLATVSHELRAPLNAILGFVQLMQEDLNLEPVHQEYLEIIYRNGEHLLHLIQNFLAIAKLDVNKTIIEETCFNLHHFLDHLQATFQPLLSSKPIHFRVDRPINLPQLVYADECKLRQVLTNLLENAIKFTPTGSVVLRVECRDQIIKSSHCSKDAVTFSPVHQNCSKSNVLSPYSLSFEIEDTGTGIAPHELDRLFEPFVQTQSGRDLQTGSGLGLYLSQQLVQLMGGEVTVRSQVGKGTCFRFEIPVHLERLENPENSQLLAPEVLDEEAIQSALARMPVEWLTQLHWSARIANEQAMFQLLDHLPASELRLKQALSEQINNFKIGHLIRWLQPLIQQPLVQPTTVQQPLVQQWTCPANVQQCN